MPSKKVKTAEDKTHYQLQSQWGNTPCIFEPVSLSLIFMGAWSSSQRKPDLDNLIAFPLDALQKVGIIGNDRQVSTINAERICLCDNCDNRTWMPRKKEFKLNCGAVKTCPEEETVIRMEVME